MNRMLAVLVIVIGLVMISTSYIGAKVPIPEQDLAVTPTIPSYNLAVGIAPKNTLIPAVYRNRPMADSKIGTITIPALDISWPIFEGTQEKQLSKGVGHYRQSVLPGMFDNSVLSGHRTTVFRKLGNLEINNLILVKTVAGVFTYKVSHFKVVDRTSRKVIVPSRKPILTLTTCYPFYAKGKTTKAFIVTANLINPETN